MKKPPKEIIKLGGFDGMIRNEKREITALTDSDKGGKDD